MRRLAVALLGVLVVAASILVGTAASASASDTLSVGASLNSGQSLWSGNGQYHADEQADGNFVVYGPNGYTWATFAGGTGNYVTVQSDGNLVQYPAGKNSSTSGAVWNAGTDGTGSANRLVMQDDGNLVLYTRGGVALWSSVTGRIPGNSTDTLGAGWSLNSGQSLWSGNGQYHADEQADGNFVVYGPNGYTWATFAGGTGNYVTVQSDGNLVQYPAGKNSSTGGAVWNAGTDGTGSANRLVMQDDGNLVLYSNSGVALWSIVTGRITGANGGGASNSALDNFVAAHPAGSEINSPWGPQCVTLVVHYLSEVYGISLTQWNASTYQQGQKSGAVLANNGWTWHQGAGAYQQGDILVWSWTKVAGDAGHVAIWYNGKLYEQNAHTTPGISLDPSNWVNGTFAGYWHHG
ncbi:hypothetical protein I6A60_11415 [Frankia sp. AgB1.9]|uniref:CHAP domain-containing protein n=1 Tax=unclassified Frankia TaxID=2632575 RepID=UPI001931FD78|nr:MULTISPECIES: CHAP domain-containing protein [unclassified Frankia]MBL7490366.1 hypothetical protein [Frankia sp. AgW1.1]MBL7548476.1 hypothetical protein [Frankia sp. AgB1.9]MBL7621366.1 hypothetical protein [Frankia sp. AgB1.8]